MSDIIKRDKGSDSFKDFLDALNNVEASKRKKLEDSLKETYHKWAQIIQGVDSQLCVAADVFLQIPNSVNGWSLDGRYDTKNKRALYFYFGNGYVGEVALDYVGDVKGHVQLGYPHLNLFSKQIMIRYGQNEEVTLDGKRKIWGIGYEREMGLPVGCAFEHDTLENKALVQFVKSHRMGDFRHDDLRRRLSEETDILEGEQEYDLTTFYGKEYELTDNLDRAKNHLVFISANYKSERYTTAMDVEQFCKLDIKSAIQSLFLKLNNDEFKDIRSIVPNLPNYEKEGVIYAGKNGAK